MLAIDNVPTVLAIGTGGWVVRVMSGRILDGGSHKGCFTDMRAHRSRIRQCGLRVWPHNALGIIASLRLRNLAPAEFSHSFVLK